MANATCSPAATQPLTDQPCLTFALRREMGPFCKIYRPYHKLRESPFWANLCGPEASAVLVVETGVGQASTKRALSWILEYPAGAHRSYRPRLVLSAGFCGALRDDLRTGDLVLATEVTDATSGETWPATCPDMYLRTQWDQLPYRGRLVTVPHIVDTPQRKYELGKNHQAVAVDMESAFVGQLCHKARIPFCCLRVVLDEANQPIAAGLATLFSSQPSHWRLLTAFLRRPSLWKGLWPLAKSSHFAAQRLARGLDAWLQAGSPSLI